MLEVVMGVVDIEVDKAAEEVADMVMDMDMVDMDMVDMDLPDLFDLPTSPTRATWHIRLSWRKGNFAIFVNGSQ